MNRNLCGATDILAARANEGGLNDLFSALRPKTERRDMRVGITINIVQNDLGDDDAMAGQFLPFSIKLRRNPEKLVGWVIVSGPAQARVTVLAGIGKVPGCDAILFVTATLNGQRFKHVNTSSDFFGCSLNDDPRFGNV